MSHSAKSQNIAVCLGCHKLVMWHEENILEHCHRCNTAVTLRKPQSIHFALALCLFAALFFIPANIFPIITLTSLGQGQPSTIMESVTYLMGSGQYAIGLIIFMASFFIPLTKILAIFFMIYSISYRKNINYHNMVAVFHLVESLGKWGMLDIFVAFILVVLVQFGTFAQVTIGAGANFFAATVLLTMFAAHALDTRLIWDKSYE